MYAKLVLRSARRSIKDYLIYIVTMTLCVTLFYSFLSISSRHYHPDLGLEYDLTMLSDGMKAAILGVTLLLLFLIRYVNNYMLLRRQKEFAVQTVMGMEQRTTAWLFFAETFLMGLVAIAAGILLGMICSQFITSMLLTSYGKPFRLSWMLFPDTALLTLIFFTACFAAIGLANIRAIRKIKVIDMLNADRAGEGSIRKSRWMPGVCVLYGILLCFMLYTGIIKKALYFDSRTALPVHILFWGNILVPAAGLLYFLFWIFRRKSLGFQGMVKGWLLCSAAASCFTALLPFIRMKYLLTIDDGTVDLYLLLLIINLCFFLSALIWLTGSLLDYLREKPLTHKYRGENLFLYGQLLSKLVSASKTMTLICLTLVLSTFLFMAAPALVGWSSGYLEIRSVYDIQMFSRYNNVYDPAGLPSGDYEQVTAFLRERDIETARDLTFSLYLPREEQFRQRTKYDFPVLAVSLSDYNTLRSMRGYDPISLKDGEFTTQWHSLAAEEDRSAFLVSHKTVETDAGTLTLAEESQHGDIVGETLYNSYTRVIYVFPDNVCQSLLSVQRNRYILTEKPVPYLDALELEKKFSKWYPERSQGAVYEIRTRTRQVNDSRAASFVLQTSMTYGAAVLLVICFTILSLQQLSESPYYKYRFGVLRKLGADEKSIRSIILRMLSFWFGLPIAAAALVSAVLTAYFFQTIRTQISVYIGMGALLTQVGVITAILIVLLLCYFVSTWSLLMRAVNKQR